MRKMTWYCLLLCVIAVAVGCAGLTQARLERFEVTARAYERALRWSDFQMAFALTANPEAPLPDFRRLKNIRITSYDVVGEPRADSETQRLAQTVQIHYVNQNNMSERVLMDEQLWTYSENDKRWKLKSAFPEFR